MQIKLMASDPNFETISNLNYLISVYKNHHMFSDLADLPLEVVENKIAELEE